jgi:hypothetical protein
MPDFMLFCLMVFAFLVSIAFGIQHMARSEVFMAFMYGIVAPVAILFGAWML